VFVQPSDTSRPKESSDSTSWDTPKLDARKDLEEFIALEIRLEAAWNVENESGCDNGE